ncbi:DNA alkylation repair protein [Flagellimonas sp.]|uniref:DNA alkylation repair protein n=1 Tax=Flagellimonas sp. TaxID=2058762 RepID=UPI003F4A29CC
MAYKQLKLWFDGDLAELLANKFSENNIELDKVSFVQNVTEKSEPLELKDRVECIADELKSHLSGDIEKDVHYFMQILGPENEKETGMFKEFYWIMPLAKYVEKYGLEHFDLSMQAIYEITKRNTGEYTIRPFLEHHQDQTLATLLNWSKDPNKHVRRLSSEGVRPRLPWANKLDAFIEDPTPILPILENLKDDPSKYVQKSVANCLNDILKDNPEVGKNVLESWSKDAGKERKWIIKHALRSLIKKKDMWAINLTQG